MWNERRLWIQWRGNVLHLELICDTPINLRSWGDIRVVLVLWQSCWGLSRVQSSKSRILMCLIGKRNCSACNAGESGLISWRGGSLMGFLELRQAHGVYSRKESVCHVGDPGSIPGSGRSPGDGNCNPLQYSGLENSTDSIVHGVAKSRTPLSDFHFLFKGQKPINRGWHPTLWEKATPSLVD